jgi:outer membrane protein OmpA-like peptidoglycan-associated protein
MLLAATALLAGGALLGGAPLCPAMAQQNPSSQQILKSLTPSPGMDSTTRGIRIAPQGGGAAQRGQPSAAAPSVNLNIDFANGSATLTPKAIQSLDALGRALANPGLAAYHFRIEGHTDTVGSPALNQALSERRAEAVVSYLSSKYGISPSRLQPVGMGEQGLLVSTPDQTAEPRNRRVLVVNAGA